MNDLETKKSPGRPKMYRNERGQAPYWCGALADAPFQNFTVGGIEFPGETERLEDGTHKTKRIPEKGVILWLSSDRVKRIKDSASRLVVQFKGARPEIANTTNKHFEKNNDDVKVGRYIYLIPCEVNSDVPFRPNVVPTPLIEE